MSLITMLHISDLDSGVLVCKLPVGEHVFGRGPLLQCDSMKVSRNHGIFKITKDGATITSTHKSGCLYQPASSSDLTTIHKDCSVKIQDGDKFALLSDKYLFKITVVTENEDAVNENCGQKDLEHLNSRQETTSLNGVYNETGNLLFKRTDGQASEDISICHNKSNELSSTSVEINENLSLQIGNETGSNTAQNKSSSSSITIKNNSSCIEAEADGNIESSSVSANIQLNRKRFSNEIMDVNSKKLKQEVITVDEKNNTAIEILSDSEGEKENEEMLTEEIKEDPVEDHTQNIQEDKNNEGDDNNPGTSAKQSKTPRNRCRYGTNCYRKNPDHKRELSHPGDSDYDTDPSDDRPNCKYGTGCYRKNADHFKDYKHSRAGVQSPHKKQNRKKRANVNKTVNVDESSEDDYDYDDPFLDDGSEDDYKGESDSDSSSGEDLDDDEIARLQKEARRLRKDANKK